MRCGSSNTPRRERVSPALGGGLVIIFGRSGEGSELNLPSLAGEHYVIFLCVRLVYSVPHPFLIIIAQSLTFNCVSEWNSWVNWPWSFGSSLLAFSYLPVLLPWKVVVFDSQVSLVKAVETVNIGTLAFVLSDELLYIKSSGGWRTVVVRRHIKPCELSIRYRIVWKACFFKCTCCAKRELHNPEVSISLV